MTAKTILIVEDDQNFARSLAMMLRAEGYRCYISHDTAGALLQAKAYAINCALIDYNLGAMLGTALLERLNAEGHVFPKIVFTAYGDVRAATAAMKLGAADFLEKCCKVDELLYAVESAIEKARVALRAADSIRDARRMLKSLTDRESEVVDAIVAGHSSKQIADALSVSQRTVEAHRANVLQKLGIANTAALVRLAVLSGLGAP